MSDNLSRAVFDALFVSGSIGNIESGGDLDLLLDGMAENAETVALDIACLSCIRDPFTTPLLSDLEREYGVPTDTRLSDAVRRETLAALVYGLGNNTGSKDNLQNALQAAGFDVQVHENSPAVDPDIFLNSVPLMVAGGDNAFAGYEPLAGPPSTAVAGLTGGYLLVNGRQYTQRPEYDAIAGGDYMFAGNGNAVAGRYIGLIQDEIIYTIPDDPNAWPFFFFVGGDATRDPGTGELTGILKADIPAERQTDFERLILKYKPIHTWAGLIINYT